MQRFANLMEFPQTEEGEVTVLSDGEAEEEDIRRAQAREEKHEEESEEDIQLKQEIAKWFRRPPPECPVRRPQFVLGASRPFRKTKRCKHIVYDQVPVDLQQQWEPLRQEGERAPWEYRPREEQYRRPTMRRYVALGREADEHLRREHLRMAIRYNQVITWLTQPNSQAFRQDQRKKSYQKSFRPPTPLEVVWAQWLLQQQPVSVVNRGEEENVVLFQPQDAENAFPLFVAGCGPPIKPIPKPDHSNKKKQGKRSKKLPYDRVPDRLKQQWEPLRQPGEAAPWEDGPLKDQSLPIRHRSIRQGTELVEKRRLQIKRQRMAVRYNQVKTWLTQPETQAFRQGQRRKDYQKRFRPPTPLEIEWCKWLMTPPTEAAEENPLRKKRRRRMFIEEEETEPQANHNPIAFSALVVH